MGIRELFTGAIFGEDVFAHKPFPEPYLRAQTLLGVAGGLALEDSQPGRESAARAGLEVLHVRYPGEVESLLRGRLAL